MTAGTPSMTAEDVEARLKVMFRRAAMGAMLALEIPVPTTEAALAAASTEALLGELARRQSLDTNTAFKKTAVDTSSTTRTTHETHDLRDASSVA